jgi:integrase
VAFSADGWRYCMVRRRTASKEIAREAERDRHRELEKALNRIGPREPMPLLKVAIQRWLAEKAGRALKTISGYKERTVPLGAAFGDRLVCDISRNDILAYRAKRLEEKFSPRTINYEIACLRGILDGYGLWGNVSRKLRWLKENHDVGRAMSYTEEDRLRELCAASLSPSLLPMFVMAIDTGLRAAELQSLRRKDLLLTITEEIITAGEVIVPKSKTDAGKGRSVPLTSRTCAVLTTWLARFPNATSDSYVFPRHSVQMLKGGKAAVIRDVQLSEPVQSW